MSQTYDIAALRAEIGPIKWEDNPILVKQKSRDFFWYSPVLKRELEAVTADVVVSPTSEVGSPDHPRGRVQARDSGDSARRGDRQLRPGDAAHGRRALEPRRDEHRSGQSSGDASSASLARC